MLAFIIPFVLIIGIGLFVYDYSEHIVVYIIELVFLSAVIGLLCWGFVEFVSYAADMANATEYEEKESVSYDLVSMTYRSDEVEEREIYCVRVDFEDKVMYKYDYIREDGGRQLATVDASNVVIYPLLEEGTPYVEIETTKVYMVNEEKDYKSLSSEKVIYNLYLPTGTILEKFTSNIESSE